MQLGVTRVLVFLLVQGLGFLVAGCAEQSWMFVQNETSRAQTEQGGPSAPQAVAECVLVYDASGNDRIDDPELSKAIDDWIAEILSENCLLAIINAWVSQASLGDTGPTPTPGPTPGPAPAPIPGPRVNGQPALLDDQFVEIARQVPGFGGMFLKDDALHVVLTDPAQAVAAEAAIANLFGRERVPSGGIRVLPGQYDFLQLKSWHDHHRMVTLALPGVISTGISESENRLKIRVDGQDKVAQVEQELARLGVPLEMVNIVVSKPFVFHSSHALTSKQRPLVGGVQLQIGSGACTLGFLAVRSNAAGFVTNSHCVGFGGLTNQAMQDVHQPTLGDGIANRIGGDKFDPPWQEGLFDPFSASECPSGRRCRFSDSAFISRDSGPDQTPAVWAHFEAIALPDLNSTSFNSIVKIQQKGGFALEGEHLEKVGRTSGRTGGEVIDTCEDINVNESFTPVKLTLFCQSIVNALSMGGDSGAPVFTWSSATLTPGSLPTATLFGIAWGGNGIDEFSFSPIFNIEFELGGLIASGDFAASSSPPEVKILQPDDGSNVAMGGLNTVTFKASVEDYEDGGYYDGSCASCEVKWNSDKEGNMGGGKVLDFVFTKAGTHTITATAEDSDGDTSTFSIKVNVGGNTPPGVTIEEPSTNDILYTGIPYVFASSSWDAEAFSPLPCNSLQWTSNKDGDPFPTTGCQPEVTFTTTGSRKIYLTGTDSQGETGVDSVIIFVVDPPNSGPPLVTILNPKNNTGLAPDTLIKLRGKATDPDGRSPIWYKWVLHQSPSGTLLAGGKTEITLATGTVQNGEEIVFPAGGGRGFAGWKPSDHVPFDCGGNSVIIYLYATDVNDTTSSAYVEVGVDYPPC